MTSRERLLTALERGKPDRLPVQVHLWTDYYLNEYLGGCDQYEAYNRFGIDPVIYVGWDYIKQSERVLANWITERKHLGLDHNGNDVWEEVITTPEGTLTCKGATNAMTEWIIEPLIRSKDDFELFRKYYPWADTPDFTPVINAQERIGDNGIVRGILWCYGQMGAWQSFCCLVGTERAIYYAIDEPDWVHYVLQHLVDKQLKIIEMMEGVPLDLIEMGGGGGSNTVISPALHREFCTTYDKQQIDALHSIGIKVVYHLCGGLMKQLDNVLQNGADGLETMTPPGMGGDCDLAEAYRQVGSKLFLIGGFNQKDGFELGTPQRARELVYECFAACPNGGYICAPCDQFFHGDPANLQAFADAAKECVY